MAAKKTAIKRISYDTGRQTIIVHRPLCEATEWGLANYIGENFSGDVLLKHRGTDEEKRKKAEETERFNREWEEEMERGRDMPTFASRW